MSWNLIQVIKQNFLDLPLHCLHPFSTSSQIPSYWALFALSKSPLPNMRTAIWKRVQIGTVCPITWYTRSSNRHCPKWDKWYNTELIKTVRNCMWHIARSSTQPLSRSLDLVGVPFRSELGNWNEQKKNADLIEPCETHRDRNIWTQSPYAI